MRAGSSTLVASLLFLGLAAAGAGCRTGYSPPPPVEAGTAPGAVEFMGENLIMSARGTFRRWDFRRVEIDREHPERSVVEIEIDVASLDTGIERRDNHLRSADFFEVETYPTATIRIVDASPDGDSESGNPSYTAKFQTRIRDVERTLDGRFEVVGTSPLAIEGELVLNRVEFGVGTPHRWWNPISTQNEIPIHFSMHLPMDGES